MAVDDLVTCITRPSADMVLTKFSGYDPDYSTGRDKMKNKYLKKKIKQLKQFYLRSDIR